MKEQRPNWFTNRCVVFGDGTLQEKAVKLLGPFSVDCAVYFWYVCLVGEESTTSANVTMFVVNRIKVNEYDRTP